MTRDPNHFLSSLPQTYFMHRDGSLLRVMVDMPDDLRHLRTELELLKRVARKSVSWSGVVDSTSAEKYQESDRTELDRILFDAWHPMIEEMIVLFDREFEDVKEEILLSVVDEEAANIVQEAAECGVLKPVDELVGKNIMKNPYGSSIPSDIEDALAAAEKAIANAAQMNARKQDEDDEEDQDSQIPMSFNIDLEQANPLSDTTPKDAEMETDSWDHVDKIDQPLEFMEETQDQDEEKNELDDEEVFDVSSNVPEDVSLPEMEYHTLDAVSSEDTLSPPDHASDQDTATPDFQEMMQKSELDIRSLNPFAFAPKSDDLDSIELDTTPVSREEQESFIANVLGEKIGPDESSQEPFELPEPEAMISASLEGSQSAPATEEEQADVEEAEGIDPMGIHQEVKKHQEESVEQVNFEIPEPLAAIESLQGKMDQITPEELFDPFANGSNDALESEVATPDTMVPAQAYQEGTDRPEDQSGISLTDPQAMITSNHPENSEGKKTIIPTTDEFADLDNHASEFDDFDESQLDTTPAEALDVEGIMASAEESIDREVAVSASDIHDDQTVVPTPEELTELQNNESEFDDFDESQLDTTPVEALDVEGIMASADEQSDQQVTEVATNQESEPDAHSDLQATMENEEWSQPHNATQLHEEERVMPPTPEELDELQHNESAFDDFDESQLDTTPMVLLHVEEIIATADKQTDWDVQNTVSHPALESNGQPIAYDESTMSEVSSPSDQTQQDIPIETDVPQQSPSSDQEPPSQEPIQPQNPFAANVPVNMNEDANPSQSTFPNTSDAIVMPEPVLPEVVVPDAMLPAELQLDFDAELPQAVHEESIEESEPPALPEPSLPQADANQPVEKASENDRSMEYTSEQAQLVVAEIEKGIRKISGILNTEVNEQWQAARQSLQQIVESHSQVDQTKQNVDTVMTELAQVRSQILTLRDETLQARNEVIQLREKASRANDDARASAQAAKSAAEQATMELENARKAAGAMNQPQNS